MKKKVAPIMHPSIIIAFISIEMSSSISSCMFGCTCMHRQHGAGAARTAAASAAASTAERRCRPAGASGSYTRAPTARRSHSKSFTGRPAASTRRAQRPRRPPSLYPLSHAVYDTVLPPLPYGVPLRQLRTSEGAADSTNRLPAPAVARMRAPRGRGRHRARLAPRKAGVRGLHTRLGASIGSSRVLW